MTEVKRFQVSGQIRKASDRIPFTIKLRATKPEDAVQKVYADLGSRHRARRFEILVQKVEEIAEETGQT